jgi:RNA polymerase subunit RPABC4/transcription elongation factor Spt4
MDNTCVCCGTVIPEGRMVCPTCERQQTKDKIKTEE